MTPKQKDLIERICLLSKDSKLTLNLLKALCIDVIDEMHDVMKKCHKKT